MSDVDVFVIQIQVHGSTQTAAPCFFSKPVLPFFLIPLEFRDAQPLKIILDLKFCAPVLKYLLEAHAGYDWMLDLANECILPMMAGQPPAVSIPSLQVGLGASSLGFRRY